MNFTSVLNLLLNIQITMFRFLRPGAMMKARAILHLTHDLLLPRLLSWQIAA